MTKTPRCLRCDDRPALGQFMCPRCRREYDRERRNQRNAAARQRYANRKGNHPGKPVERNFPEALKV